MTRGLHPLVYELACFERVARIRLVPPEMEFRKWLRMPHEALGKSPLILMEQGEWQAMPIA